MCKQVEKSVFTTVQVYLMMWMNNAEFGTPFICASFLQTSCDPDSICMVQHLLPYYTIEATTCAPALIFQVKNYNASLPLIYQAPDGLQLHPGDYFEWTCHYDTRNSTRTVWGGFRSMNETCTMKASMEQGLPLILLYVRCNKVISCQNLYELLLAQVSDLSKEESMGQCIPSL